MKDIRTLLGCCVFGGGVSIGVDHQCFFNLELCNLVLAVLFFANMG
jgi:hypothetical protein